MNNLVWEDGELERFGEYVETLEIAVDYLRVENAARTRQALIALDNLAEVLMYEICESSFASDTFHSKLFPPRFSRAYKSKVRWGFHEKVEMLGREQVLATEEGKILDILHRSRTPAFHRYDYDPRAAWVIAARSVPIVAHLLGQVFRGISVGGLRKSPEWITRYGLPSGLVDFTAASACIARELVGAIVLDSDGLRRALVSDLETRLASLDRAIEDHLYGPNEAELDEILRHEEFWAQFDDDLASKEYRELIYIVTEKRETVDREEFQRREEAYRQRVTQELGSFRGRLASADLKNLRGSLPRIDTATTDAEALTAYMNLDEQLERYERAISNGAIRIDQAAELESDIRRGK